MLGFYYLRSIGKKQAPEGSDLEIDPVSVAQAFLEAGDKFILAISRQHTPQ
jgi:hypothetical protein